MRIGQAIRTSVKAGLNHLYQQAPGPIRTRLSRPTSIYILITHRCNLRCTMCGIPFDLVPELTVDEWRSILDDLGRWAAGYAKLQFSGGEPLAYQGFFDVLEHSVACNLLPGFCTNATTITEEDAHRIMTMGLENVNVSLDGVGPVNDAVRGAGAFERADRGIRRLIAAREQAGTRTPLILKTCLMGANAEDVPNLIAYAEQVGADELLFQPMEMRTGDWGDNRGLFECEWPVMQKALDAIRQSRANHGVVMNSLDHIALFEAYFKNPTGEYPGRQLCTVGDNSLMMRPDGTMLFCGEMGTIGRATETPPSIAWRSEAAEASRKRIFRCTKGCLQTCYANKKFRDKVAAFMLLVRGSKARAARAAK